MPVSYRVPPKLNTDLVHCSGTFCNDGRGTLDMKNAETDPDEVFNEVFHGAVELGNSQANSNEEADRWDIADGLLAGAVQYWLYSRQPCGDPRCEDCVSINTAGLRLAELQRMVKQFAEESEYYHSPSDTNAGRA